MLPWQRAYWLMRSCVRDYRHNIGVEKGESMAEHFKYEEMTDEELIDQLREGDRQVMDYICDKYKNLVRSS